MFPYTTKKFHNHHHDQDQFPPDWDEWPVDHDCDPKKPLENLVENIYVSHDEDNGSRFWNVQKDAQYTIKAVPLKHRIPCFGYVIQESDKPGKLDIEKAKKLGVKPGPDLGMLKSGKSVIAIGTGQEIKPEGEFSTNLFRGSGFAQGY